MFVTYLSGPAAKTLLLRTVVPSVSSAEVPVTVILPKALSITLVTRTCDKTYRCMVNLHCRNEQYSKIPIYSFEPPRETKIGSRNRRAWKIKGKDVLFFQGREVIFGSSYWEFWNLDGLTNWNSTKFKGKGKVCIWAKWPISAGAYPAFLSMKQLGVFLLPPWMGF